jgi:tetrathionate reductase subunit A
MLARGGVFIPYEKVSEGDKFKHGVQRVAVYNEELAATTESLTGKRFSGSLKYTPPTNSTGRKLEEIDADLPFAAVTYKKSLHTQSRTLWCDYAMEIMPENFVEMNKADAEKAGIQDGDLVRVTSKSRRDGIQGKARITNLVRPGVVAISFHYGHTQFGASRLYIENGETVFQGGKTVIDEYGLIPNPKFATGLNFNDVARLDENLGNTPMVDTIGGIPDFSSTRVNVEKI